MTKENSELLCHGSFKENIGFHAKLLKIIGN